MEQTPYNNIISIFSAAACTLIIREAAHCNVQDKLTIYYCGTGHSPPPLITVTNW